MKNETILTTPPLAMNSHSISRRSLLGLGGSALSVLALGGVTKAFADGGSGSTGGTVTNNGKVIGYTIWWDHWTDGKNPDQGWNEDSVWHWKRGIESYTELTMADEYVNKFYLPAAREAIRDAQQRSNTGRARVVGAIGVGFAGKYGAADGILSRAYSAYILDDAGARAANTEEFPDNVGWSTRYNNDNLNSPDWRNWLYRYGADKAGAGTYSDPGEMLTVIVYAVAEGEPKPPKAKAKVHKTPL